MRERLDTARIDGLQLLNQPKYAAKLIGEIGAFVIGHGDSRQSRDAFQIVRGEFHGNGD
jgi:hypothetical protein